MSRKRNALLWILKLPFRPYLRWGTGLLVVLLVISFLTGHLGLAGRYAWGRLWPFGTPLIEYAPADARTFVLLNLTQPGASKLKDCDLSGNLKSRVEGIAQALDVNLSRGDILQVMVAANSATDNMIVAMRGRFSASNITESLEQRGYKSSQLNENPLLVHRDTGEAVCIVGSSLVLYGAEGSISRALERAQGRMDNLDDSEAFEQWLDHIGHRHTLLALRINPERQASLSELAAGSSERLEALGFTLDTNGEVDLELNLMFGPSNAGQVKTFDGKLSKTVAGLKSGSGIFQPGANVKPLVESLAVEPDEKAVWVKTAASPHELGTLLATMENPNELLAVALSLAAAGAVGNMIPDLLPNRPHPAGLPQGSGTTLPNAIGNAIQKGLETMAQEAGKHIQGALQQPTTQPTPKTPTPAPTTPAPTPPTTPAPTTPDPTTPDPVAPAEPVPPTAP